MFRNALLASLFIVSLAHAQPSGEDAAAPLRPHERVEFALEDGTIADLVRMMVRITGHHFIVTGTPREIHASVSGDGPVTAAEAYRAFLAILHQSGLTILSRGAYFVVATSENVARRPTDLYDDRRALPNDEQFVTWIHHVEHVPLEDAAQLLDSLHSSDGQIISYAPTGTLILIDTGANLRRMRRILDEIDVAHADAHVWIEPLHFADAQNVADLLQSILDEDAPSRPAAAAPAPAARPAPGAQPEHARSGPIGHGGDELYRLLPEPRTNSLVIVATQTGYARVMALVRELDRDAGGQTTVHLHRLQHADAEHLAAALSSQLGGSSSGGSGGPSGGAPSAQASSLGARVHVEPYTDLNAILVTATSADDRRLIPLIEELDSPPRQVFLDMVVLELNVDQSQSLGLNIGSGLANLVGQGTMGLLTGGAGGYADASELLTGIAFQVAGPLVTDSRLPGGSLPSFGAAIHALSGSSQGNILSAPHVTVLDNHEATINIGQSVPTQGSSVSGIPVIPGISQQQTQTATTAMNAMNPMAMGGANARRNVGTIVEVTPHVSDEGEIRLHVRAEDSRQGAVAAGNLNALTFDQSIAETELCVHDGETAVIGGLMHDSYENTRSGIPLLSEIPLLGALFGQTHQHTVRRNLLFFVTPFIVRGREDMRSIYERRMRERREFMDRHAIFEEPWHAPMDYSRSRGMVLEIDAAIDEADRQMRLAAEAPPPPEHRPSPPVDVEQETPSEPSGPAALP